MRSAADMDEVGCPEPAPELERMLSTLNCWASERHCSAPAVSWLICCATTNLLGRIAISTDSTSPTPRWRFGNRPAAPGIDPTDGGLPALLESRGREEKTLAVRSTRRVRLGERVNYGSGGSQDDAGTLRGGERRGRTRKPASCTPGRGLCQEAGGHDLGFWSPGRQDGQTDRTLPEGPLYRRERSYEGSRRLGYGQQGFPERRLRGAPQQGSRLRREPRGDLRGRRLRRRGSPLPPERPRGDRACLAGPLRQAALQTPLEGRSRLIRS